MLQWFLLLLILPITSLAFEIPKGLTRADRKEVTRILGVNSANKSLSNPYPLGGYSGFEVGYALEFINVRDIRRLGCAPGVGTCPNEKYTNENEWRYSRFSIGKGIYKDVDLFLSFIPPIGSLRISDYGAQVRWAFYQAKFLPINISAIGHFNQLNFNDTFMNRNLGAELMAGVNVDNFALYFGGGWITARSTFIGRRNGFQCNEDCTADPDDPTIDRQIGTSTMHVNQMHTVVGFSLHFQNLFAAAQVDRYRDAVYSIKLGLRL